MLTTSWMRRLRLLPLSVFLSMFWTTNIRAGSPILIGSKALQQVSMDKVDASKKKFYLSAILDWFGEDFGSSQAEQLRRISGWLPKAAAQSAARQNAVSVSYLEYDWKLNKQ